MPKRIQHLRGTREEYELYGTVPGDGELALEEHADGTIRIKVGDGTTPYDELPYLGCTVEKLTQGDGEDVALTLKHGYEYRLGMHSSIALSLPEIIEEDYRCDLVFDTSIGIPSISYPKKLIFVGDHTDGGLLRVQKRTRYTVEVRNRTGAIYATVRAASHDLGYASYNEIVSTEAKHKYALYLENGSNLIDIAIGGVFADADTDGFVGGIGSYDHSSEDFGFDLTISNAHMQTFAKLKSYCANNMPTLATKFGYFATDDGFGFSVNHSQLLYLMDPNTTPTDPSFQYRIRMKIRVEGYEREFTVGESLTAPISVRYTDASIDYPTMQAIGTDTCLLDFTTDAQKRFSIAYVNGTSTDASFVILDDADFLVCAIKEGFVPPEEPVEKSFNIRLKEPLRAAGTVRDTLSLTSATVTRRIYAEPLLSFDVYNEVGTYVTFVCDLPVSMATGGEGVLQGFSKGEDPESLCDTPYSYCFDAAAKKLYFSGGEDEFDYYAMEAYIFDNFETIGFAYERATPVTETVTLPDGLHPFDHYTFLVVPMLSNAVIITTSYQENAEEGEE